MNKILLSLIIFPFFTYAQFDSLIFSKYLNLNSASQDIYPLGDQNGDGFDDIMLYDCDDKRGYIYFGGSPMDTISVNNIQFYDSIYTSGPSLTPQIVTIDINSDGIEDIVVASILYDDTLYWHPGAIKIYYGGEVIDSIPNQTFNPPPGAKDALLQGLKDFNGDGRSELVFYDANLPFSDKQYGTLYFYNTESQFDTIPHYMITGDSVNFIQLREIISSGDINGDGKTDFTIYGYKGEFPATSLFRSFYIGNENFVLEPAATYYQDEHSFNCEQMKIINDINGDNKDDIIIMDYGFYPYYYQNAILHGSFPIDTIPDVGLNTQYLGLNLGETYSLGDVNGDGFNDFFGNDYAAYPDVRLWVGGREMPYTSDDQANKTWFGTSGGFGRAIGAVGDVDGDDVNDVAICEIPYGMSHCEMSRVYIFKGDTSVIGDTGEVGIIIEKDIIKDYYLYEPYPNPFNPSTSVSYELKESGFVQIKIFDTLGREICILVNEEEPAGYHNIVFNSEKYTLSSGVYFLDFSIKTGGGEIYRASKKIMLIK